MCRDSAEEGSVAVVEGLSQANNYMKYRKWNDDMDRVLEFDI